MFLMVRGNPVRLHSHDCVLKLIFNQLITISVGFIHHCLLLCHIAG